MTGNLKKRGGFSIFGKKEMDPSEPISNVKNLVIGLQHHESYREKGERHGVKQYTPKEFNPLYYVDFENNKGKQYVYSGLNKNKTTGKYYLNFNEVYKYNGVSQYTQNIGTENSTEADKGNPNNYKPVHIDLNTDDENAAKNMDISDKKIYVINESMKKYKENMNYLETKFKQNGNKFPAGIAPSFAKPHKFQRGFDKPRGGKKRRTKKRKSMKKKQRKTKRRKSLKKRKSIKKRKV